MSDDASLLPPEAAKFMTATRFVSSKATRAASSAPDPRITAPGAQPKHIKDSTDHSQIGGTQATAGQRAPLGRELDGEGAVGAPPALLEGVTLSDFQAYMPAHTYIFAPTCELWPATSVDARIPPQPLLNTDATPALDRKCNPIKIKASAWLDRNRAVEQMTWSPGEPHIVEDRLISEGGWIARPGCRCFNLYRPPSIVRGDPNQASPWIEHVKYVYGDHAPHIIAWLAHRAQKPYEKINHALVLGGAQGIGKDTLLEPVKAAVGPWNFVEVSPQHMLGRFNAYAKSVILRVSEARDLGDMDRYKFYEHLKAYTAAPPDVLRVDEKHLREYSVLNVCGVVITTNYKTDGIYLPADDRRHFVAWSTLTKDNFPPGYWSRLWRWFYNGGANHVAAHLREVDISGFDAKAPPPRTVAWHDIVDSSRAPEDAELADALDRAGSPDVTTLAEIAAKAERSLQDYLLDRKNSRLIPHRLDACGYEKVRNEGAKDGLWKISGKRQAVYARKGISMKDRHLAIERNYGSRSV
jgi:hypothetical protein